jgi:hypothetical protein
MVVFLNLFASFVLMACLTLGTMVMMSEFKQAVVGFDIFSLVGLAFFIGWVAIFCLLQRVDGES